MLRPLRELPDWLVVVTDATRVAEALTASASALWDGQFRVAGVDTGRARLTHDRWSIQYEVSLTDDAGEQHVRRVHRAVPPRVPCRPIAELARRRRRQGLRRRQG